MRRFVAGFALLACSCAPVTTPDGTVHQLAWDVLAVSHVPALVVIVVDDEPDANGQSVRAALTPEAIAPSFDGLLQRFPNDTSSSDPAGAIQDVRAIVVHPSSRGFVSPLDDPSLAITRAAAGPADVTAIASAAAAHAQENVASAGAPYPLLDVTREVVSLLMRERAPQDARESALVASLPPTWTTVSVAIVTAHDDASAAPPASFVPPNLEGGEGVHYQIIEPCTGSDPGPPIPRLAAWSLASAGAFVIADTRTDSCVYPSPNVDLPLTEFEPGDTWCTSFLPASEIARDASGAAECVVTLDVDAPSCDPSRGWADPLSIDGSRRPFLVVDGHGPTERRCEILQLQGPARASCETTLACDDCAPGVCFTDAQPSGARCTFARFVDGALPPNAYLHFTCNLSP